VPFLLSVEATWIYTSTASEKSDAQEIFALTSHLHS
jgi:hypothetical protein